MNLNNSIIEMTEVRGLFQLSAKHLQSIRTYYLFSHALKQHLVANRQRRSLTGIDFFLPLQDYLETQLVAQILPIKWSWARNKSSTTITFREEGNKSVRYKGITILTGKEYKLKNNAANTFCQYIV